MVLARRWRRYVSKFLYPAFRLLRLGRSVKLALLPTAGIYIVVKLVTAPLTAVDATYFSYLD